MPKLRSLPTKRLATSFRIVNLSFGISIPDMNPVVNLIIFTRNFNLNSPWEPSKKSDTNHLCGKNPGEKTLNYKEKRRKFNFSGYFEKILPLIHLMNPWAST